ncbi:MAG: hypothetical protein VX784_11455, partial [Pseudomonadota bacterium]|nr:hypothetical protein [Pseudomonadota bacterium]
MIETVAASVPIPMPSFCMYFVSAEFGNFYVFLREDIKYSLNRLHSLKPCGFLLASRRPPPGPFARGTLDVVGALAQSRDMAEN